MSYVVEDIAGRLKEARERKGLSQRALSAHTGVPQGQISKIENGAVDLRLSSLITLARALDVELVLVPRKVLPAVNAIVRGAEGEVASSQPMEEWRRFSNALEKLSGGERSSDQYAQMVRTLSDLRHFPMSNHDRRVFRKSYELFKRAVKDGRTAQPAISDALVNLRSLRNKLAHGHEPDTESTIRPAYQLDGDDNG